MLNVKTCSKCKKEHTIDLFNKDSTNSDGFCSQCKICKYATMKLRRSRISNATKNVPEYKTCIGCKTEKCSDAFTRLASNIDGLAVYCKDCRRNNMKRQKEIRNTTPLDIDPVKVKKCHKCELDLQVSQYGINFRCKDNLSNICNSCKPKSSWTVEKQRESEKKYRAANPEKMREKYKKQAQNPSRRLRDRLNKRIQQALLTKNVTKRNTTVNYIGCSIEFFKRWIEFQFIDDMSWTNMGKWHLDHVKPCVAFDLTNEDEVLMCFNWTNIQPLWGPDNLSKSDKIDDVLIAAQLQKALQFETTYAFSAQNKGGELLETP